MDGQFVLRNESAKRHADQLMRLVAEDTIHGRVDRGKAAVKVKGRNDIVGRVDQQAVALLTVRQRLFRDLSFSDIKHKAKTTLWLARACLAGEGDTTFDQHPAHRAVRAHDAMFVLKGAGPGSIEAVAPQGLETPPILRM